MAPSVLHCCGIPEVVQLPELVGQAFPGFISPTSLALSRNHLGFPSLCSLVCQHFLKRTSEWEAPAMRLVVFVLFSIHMVFFLLFFLLFSTPCPHRFSHSELNEVCLEETLRNRGAFDRRLGRKFLHLFYFRLPFYRAW